VNPKPPANDLQRALRLRLRLLERPRAVEAMAETAKLVRKAAARARKPQPETARCAAQAARRSF
jgi:hypothetical protein